MSYDVGRATVHALQTRAVLVGALLVAGCSDELTATQDQGEAQARFVNAAPTASPVDVRWAGASAFTGVGYGAVGADGRYLTLPAGVQRLSVHAAATGTMLIAGDINTFAGRRYTTAFVRVGNGYDVILLRDTAAAPQAGRGKLRVAHFAVVAQGRVDVYVTAPGADLAAESPTFPNVPMRSATPYVELDAGTWRVRVTAEGAKTALLDTGAIDVAAGSVRTVFAIDPVTAGIVQLGQVVVDDG